MRHSDVGEFVDEGPGFSLHADGDIGAIGAHYLYESAHHPPTRAHVDSHAHRPPWPAQLPRHWRSPLAHCTWSCPQAMAS